MTRAVSLGSAFALLVAMAAAEEPREEAKQAPAPSPSISVVKLRGETLEMQIVRYVTETRTTYRPDADGVVRGGNQR